MIRKLFAASFLLPLLLAATTADASCRCACVNGQSVPLCTESLDIPPSCGAQLCSIPPPSIPPVEPLSIPPVGTHECHEQQVYNERTQTYEWKEICE